MAQAKSFCYNLKVKNKSFFLITFLKGYSEVLFINLTHPLMEADSALFTPSLCQCSVLRVFKAIATRIRGKSKRESSRGPLAPKAAH